MIHRARRSIGLFFAAALALRAPTLQAQPEQITEARAAHWTGSGVSGDESVRSVAETSAPSVAIEILGTHERGSDLRLRTLAQALRYERAARLGIDATERDRLLSELRRVAEDRAAPAYARNEACRVLLISEWPARDAWYEKLLADPTLRAPRDGAYSYSPLSWAAKHDPQRWAPRLIALLAQAGTVRSTIAHILAQLADQGDKPPRRDIALALLPWLFDRGWAEDMPHHPSPRANYIASLSRIDLKEAVPGLIHVVETEHDYVAARAADALIRYRDARALPALRKALPEHMRSEWERQAFLRAIAACGGVSTKDGVSALEAYARLAATPAGLRKLQELDPELGDPTNSQLAQGILLARDETNDDPLVAAVIERVQALRATEPRVARALEAPLFVWPAGAAQRYVVSRLADETLDNGLLRRALEERNRLVASRGDELRRLLRGGGLPAGRAAAVLEDASEAARILRERDEGAILGLLRSALLSDLQTHDDAEDSQLLAADGKGGAVPLPIASVGPLLAHANPAVIAAARTWLVNEGGPVAWAWIKSRGQPVTLPAAKTPIYRIGGVAPGMTRAEVRRAGGAPREVDYTESGRVASITGTSLQDGARTLIPARATAADVRALFGRPDGESAGHVVGVLGGYFWRYKRGGISLVFAFADDRFTLGRRARLFSVSLGDIAELERLRRAEEE